MEAKMNSVKSLHQTPFGRRKLKEQLQIKQVGPEKPDLDIRQTYKERGREYARTFHRSSYTARPWLTGCSEANALFCFPCLLFHRDGADMSWIQSGIKDLKHLSEKAKKHEKSRDHIESAMQLAMFGKPNIASQLDESYRQEIRKHNEEVVRNRHALCRIIECIKFCGAFELALRSQDESGVSNNPGIFRGLVDFVASLDTVLQDNLHGATVFTSKPVQNDVLGCMLSVLKEHIIEDIRGADFISIQVDETVDTSSQRQLVLIFRYIDKTHNVQERFFELLSLQNATAESIAMVLLERLSYILPEDQRNKLISQAYDGANVMREATGGVQRKIQDVYVNAHYIHCYAHQLYLIMQQVTSHIPKVRQFFSDLAGFAGFFSRCPKRTSVLDETVARRLARRSTVIWNFHSRAVNTVFDYNEDLIQCFQTIRESGDFDADTIREAGGLVRLLEDDDFCFFLEMFHKIMPHVNLLYSRLQRRTMDDYFAQSILKKFTDSIVEIRDSLPDICGKHGAEPLQPPLSKKRRVMDSDELQRIATEVCDTVLAHARERLAFTKHLVGATLLQGEHFLQYVNDFPDDALNTTVEAYPILNKNKLKTELSVIYNTKEFRKCSGAVALFQLFVECNLDDTFSETVTLLKILITTPMITPEAERCFYTLERIKNFLRNTVTRDQLNALAMLSMEKSLVRDVIPNFNHRVIEKFASLQDRCIHFQFKR